MLLVLLETARNRRLPALAQFFERRYIEIAVMIKAFQLWHAARHETPVLTHGITAHWRFTRGYEMFQEINQRLFGIRFGNGCYLNTIDQTGAPVRALVPRIHAVQYF